MDTPSALAPRDLRCDRRCAPLGVASAQPELSWRFAALAAPDPAARQTAWHVLAATSADRLQAGQADLWDSGCVEGDCHFNIAYAGRTVPAGQRIWWTVRVWDAANHPSEFAPATWWETALGAADWAPASWIAADYRAWTKPWPAPHLRREFSLSSAPVRARAYVCGLGYHELYLNGSRWGDAVLDPAQTDYEAHALYVTHDVTAALRPGRNAIGLILGEGWFHQDRVWKGAFAPYGNPGAIAKLVVECADGSTQVIATDATWSAAAGPIVSNNVYAGEDYDARRELPRWSEPGTPGGDWHSAIVTTPLSPRLVPQTLPPIRRTQELPAVARREVTPGTWVYDFGQNFAGWARLQVQAPPGTTVCLRFAEDIYADGSINPLSTGVVHTRCVQTDRYTSRGAGREAWEPRFTYHGFRYVEVTGLAGEPPLDLLTGIAVHTDFAAAGAFACSDPLLNRLHETARWTLRSNLHGVPNDCPARERCGWLGDAHTITEVTLLNYDAVTFWRKYHRDIRQTLGRGGTTYTGAPADPRVPANIAPGQRHCGPARPDWAVALVLIPWHLHVYAGDRAILAEAYPAMRNFTTYLQAMAPDLLVREGYGDWCPPGAVEPTEPPVALTSTAFYFQTVSAMAQIAATLGHQDDAKVYDGLAKEIRDAFVGAFYRRRRRSFGGQTADAVALAFGLVPAGDEVKVAAALARCIRKRHRGHFSTGIHGLRHLFDVLCAHGQPEVAWQVLQAEGFPGFKHHFGLGATTFWEVFYDPWMHLLHDRSLNHPMQAAFAAWLFHGVGGIRPDPAQPGFRRIRLRPHLVRLLDWAEASHATPAGEVRSRWERKGRKLTWTIAIPANSTATVTVPARAPHTVRLNGAPISDGAVAAPGLVTFALPPGPHRIETEVGSKT